MEKIYPDPDAVLHALAEFIVDEAATAIAARGDFSFVTSGGNSPKKLYELLTGPLFRPRIQWEKVTFFFGDERYVPHDHPDSNFRMVKSTLFDPLQISKEKIYGIDTTLPAEESAKLYEAAIRDYFNGKPCQFDLILLGLGDNSHTASLFPYTPVLSETKALTAGLFIPEVNMFRITVTAPLINLGRTIAFLVYGSAKADAVHHVLREDQNIEEYPAQLVRPELGHVIWFFDEAAAARIR